MHVHMSKSTDKYDSNIVFSSNTTALTSCLSFTSEVRFIGNPQLKNQLFTCSEKNLKTGLMSIKYDVMKIENICIICTTFRKYNILQWPNTKHGMLHFQL